jgi:hypothetical protein
MNGTGTERALLRNEVIGRPDILGIKHDAADGALGKLVVHVDDARVGHPIAREAHQDHLADH